MAYIKATNDLAFKKVFASIGNEDIVAGLVNDFYGFLPEQVVIESPYSIKAYAELEDGAGASVLRYTEKDIVVSLEATGFTSELQMRQVPYFDARSFYYASTRYCDNYNKTERMMIGADGKPLRYSSLVEVYSLSILGFVRFADDDDAFRFFNMYDVKHAKRFDGKAVTLGYFELPKHCFDNENQRLWREYFLGHDIGEGAPAYIRKARATIDVANLSEEERRMISRIEKAEADYYNERHGAYMDGLEEGREEERKCHEEERKRHEEEHKRHEEEREKTLAFIKELAGDAGVAQYLQSLGQ
jgi:hypothetical protein